jgi:hypothetical protein
MALAIDDALGIDIAAPERRERLERLEAARLTRDGARRERGEGDGDEGDNTHAATERGHS